MKNIKTVKQFGLVLFLTTIVIFIFTRLGNKDLYPSDSVRTQLERFQEVFYYINRFYVEVPDKEKIMTGAIEGMLSELDPHSIYIPAKNVEKVQEEFEGKFEGIGIEFIILSKILTVVSPIVGGPSEAVGILPGDQIIRINGESAYGITEDQVQQKLRGPKGTTVNVTIQRPGQAEPFDVVITRDQIPIYSVISSFMLDDQETGYVYLNRFSKTTSDELEKALVDLEAKGMKNLVLDLRMNSGGFLEQAFEVTDKFLPAGYKIVYTKGRASEEEAYYSTSAGTHKLYPLIVMIDHGSASASEIVAGAIQDLDRGLVVGETSFGKGLVQHQINLRDGSALRLTVARYYTPSGRLIQRPYDKGLMDYYADAYNDSLKVKPDSLQKFVTQGGRTVYGGGGITPDTILTSPRITRFTNNLIRKRVFFEFGSTYGSKHRELAQNFVKFLHSFEITEEMLDQFKDILKKQNIPLNEQALSKDLPFIKVLLKAELARNLWDSQHYYQVRISADSQINTALNLLPEAKRVFGLHSWEDVEVKKPANP
jgi:carboxyl-terminal processing protease